MNQVLKYAGGKSRIAPWIISLFPPHNNYCEPFFGSGAVFFNKAPVRIETINDINSEITELFRVIREHTEELCRAIAFTPFSREEYMIAYEKADDPIERARRTLTRYHQSFSPAARSKNSWRNVTCSSGPFVTKAWNELPELVIEAAKRLKHAQIENCDALELIKRFDNSDALIYIDPPYPLAIREKNLYQYEMTDEQHIELLHVVKRSKAKIALSSYDNELYNRELEGWACAEKKCVIQIGQIRTEKLYMNYDPPLLAISLKN